MSLHQQTKLNLVKLSIRKPPPPSDSMTCMLSSLDIPPTREKYKNNGNKVKLRREDRPLRGEGQELKKKIMTVCVGGEGERLPPFQQNKDTNQ